MTSLREQITSSESNNLNAIRLALAFMVILSHSFPLTLGPNSPEPLVWLNHRESLGGVAVEMFFFISGMLITGSWLRSKSMQTYFLKRVLRIYPGYIVAVGFSAVVVWSLSPEFRLKIGHGRWWFGALLQDCMTLDSSSLRDSAIFAHNPFPAAGNGSLWTIGKEFACYILVAIFGLFCLFKRRFLVLLMTTVVFLIYAEGLVVGADVTYFQTRFLTYYLIGMLAWLWRDKVPFSATFALACLITLLATVWFSPWFQLFFPFAASYLVLWLGFAPRLGFLNWTRKTDISYGTYLYAWPVQQIVAMNQSLRNPWANFLIATPIILLLAWFSWILVEKRFLALKTFSDLDFDPALPIEKSATKGGTYMLPAKR